MADIDTALNASKDAMEQLIIAGEGSAIADEQFEGSGWVPLYMVDTTANTLTQITNDPGSDGRGDVRQNTMIRRSADRSFFLFTESNISSGPLRKYGSLSTAQPRAPPRASGG